MRRMRFLALGIVSFVVAIVGTLLAPGTFVNRAFSAALCTLFSFNWTVCTVDLGGSSQRVVAANPPAVVADISDYLQAQRDPSEFGDEPSAPSPQQSNPQAPPFPQDPGPNFPVRREFDGNDLDRTSENDRFQATVDRGTEVKLVKDNQCIETYTLNLGGSNSYVESAVIKVPVDGQCNNDSGSLFAKFEPNMNTVIFRSSDNVINIKISGLNTNEWRISDVQSGNDIELIQIRAIKRNKITRN